MKSLFFRNVLFFLLLVFFTFPIGCTKTDVLPEESVAGKYKFINNPLLCALPTMSDVKIKDVGSTYNLTCTLNKTSNESLSNITVEKLDNTNNKLYFNGKEVGIYSFMKYSDFKNETIETKEGWVLMLRFDNDNKHFEFMGRK